MKIIKTIAILGVLGALSATASADVYYSVDGGPATPFAPSGSITDTFSGAANMTKSCLGFNVNLGCNLDINGTLSDSGTPNGLTLDNLTANVSGSGSSSILKCSDIKVNIPVGTSVTGLTSPDSFTDDSPVAFSLPVVEVNTVCGNCSGPLSATFSNANGGQFTFLGTIPGTLGSCSVSGTLTAAPTTYGVYVD